MDDRFLRRRAELLAIEEQEAIKKYGWVFRAVFADDGIHANYHTHGLLENFGHPDLQMTIPIHPNHAHAIISGMVAQIQKGRMFTEGRADRVIEKFDVLLKTFQEDGRDVLRVCIPDPTGNLPDEEDCEEIYQTQLDDYDFDAPPIYPHDHEHDNENVHENVDDDDDDNVYVCKHCNNDIRSGEPCIGAPVFSGGKEYPPVRFGDESFDIAGEQCPWCLVKRGGFHHPGCVAEKCPICGGLISECDC